MRQRTPRAAAVSGGALAAPSSPNGGTVLEAPPGGQRSSPSARGTSRQHNLLSSLLGSPGSSVNASPSDRVATILGFAQTLRTSLIDDSRGLPCPQLLTPRSVIDPTVSLLSSTASLVIPGTPSDSSGSATLAHLPYCLNCSCPRPSHLQYCSPDCGAMWIAWQAARHTRRDDVLSPSFPDPSSPVPSKGFHYCAWCDTRHVSDFTVHSTIGDDPAPGQRFLPALLCSATC